MATLVQILLPLYDEGGSRQPAASFALVREELTERFGGMTAYARAPAEGVWEDATRRREHDDLVVYEVMADALDRAWWADYRRELERRFRQERVVVRAAEIEVL